MINAKDSNASFTGTRVIDVVVVMVAGLFFANMVMQPGEGTQTLKIYAAELDTAVVPLHD
jgi:hypothetical protein